MDAIHCPLCTVLNNLYGKTIVCHKCQYEFESGKISDLDVAITNILIIEPTMANGACLYCQCSNGHSVKCEWLILKEAFPTPQGKENNNDTIKNLSNYSFVYWILFYNKR